MKTNYQLAREHAAQDRLNRQQSPIALKVLHRLERRIRSRRPAYAAYEGFTIAGHGDVLLHMRGQDGQRRSIRISPFGHLSRAEKYGNYILNSRGPKTCNNS